MKIQQLFEGAAPKLPGAVSGIQVMTPQQFVAKSAAGEEPNPEKNVAEDEFDIFGSIPDLRKDKKTGNYYLVHLNDDPKKVLYKDGRFKPLTPEAEKHIERMMGRSLNEADGGLLGAQTRPFGGQEFQDYMGRIAGREKAKTDKYKLPYIHRSSVIKYYNEQGQ